jgi:hypothetical protein
MTRLALGLAALLLASCSKTAEPQPQEKAAPAPAPAPAPAAASASASTSTAKGASDIAYDVPKGWEVVPGAKPMRKATLRVPKAPGDTEDAELSVSEAGGSKEANIARWANQFGKGEPSKTEERTVNGLKVTVVEVKGPYAGMGGGPKKENYMLLGAMVEAAPLQFHFFKMVGPEKTVTAAQKDFDAFVGSFRAK